MASKMLLSPDIATCRQLSHSQATCSAASKTSLHACDPRQFGRRRLRAWQHAAPPCRRHSTRALTSSSEADATVSSLQDELQAAVSAEDYQRAAKLRDELQRLQQDSTAAVAEANRKFYAAFQHCSFQHLVQVLESWRLVLRGEFKIRLENVRIHTVQDTGYVTCVEVMNAGEATGRTIATNIFEKQGGVWKMVLHHGGPLPGGL